jgi:DNA repair exonuclease SbcCD ATPase subunit
VIELRALATAVCCLIAIFQGRAGSLDDMERQIRGVVAQRQASERERAGLVSEAAKLAEAIGLAQSRAGSPSRASAPLERQLRDFDRLAARLDAVDRTLKDYNTTIARLRKAVALELDKQARQAREADPLRFAALATQLETTRRRIDELTGPPREFRPLLIVRPSATDTAADLDQKLAVLDAEQARGTEALVALDQDLTVMGGRMVVTRRLLTDLEAAARGAPPDLRLIQRQVDEVQNRLRDLDASRRDLQRVRETVVQELAEVRRQIAECRTLRRATIQPG